jgi:hypothetical protein
MHVVIVGGGVGMASVGPQDGAIAPHEAQHRYCASTCVVHCAPHSPPDLFHKQKLRWVHCPTCLTTRLSIEALHRAIVQVLGEDTSGPCGWEGLESGCCSSAL